MQRLVIYVLKRLIVTAMVISIIVLLTRGERLPSGAERGFILLVLAGILLGLARLVRLWGFHSGWIRTQTAKGRMRTFGDASLIAIVGIFALGLLQLVIAEFT